MSKSISPPDYSSFSIADLELQFDAVSAMLAAASNALNQPKAINELTGRSRPGAETILKSYVEPFDHKLRDLADHLRGRRVADADDEDLRVRLLMRYDLEFGGADASEVAGLYAGRKTRIAA